MRAFILTSVVMVTMCSFAFAQEATVTPLFAAEMGDLQNQEGLMLTVDYPPGVESAAHRHNAHVFVYVLEGSVFMQVEGGERQRLSAGETFYETPADIHTVSMNASETEPAKILVYMVKSEGAPATVPAH